MSEPQKKKTRFPFKLKWLFLLTGILFATALIGVYYYEPKQVASELAKVALQHANAGRLDEAATLLERACQREPNNASYYFNLGEAYLGLDRIDDAASALYKAVLLSPQDVQYNVEYARVLSVQNNIDASAEMLKRAVLLGFCDRGRLDKDPDYDAVKLSPKWNEIETLLSTSTHCTK